MELLKKIENSDKINAKMENFSRESIWKISSHLKTENTTSDIKNSKYELNIRMDTEEHRILNLKGRSIKKYTKWSTLRKKRKKKRPAHKRHVSHSQKEQHTYN